MPWNWSKTAGWSLIRLRRSMPAYPFNPFAWHVVAETKDYYQTAEVHTRRDDVQTGDITYKPAVTPQVAAAKESWLGRVYLDWSEFPLVTDVGNDPVAGAPPPEPNWHTVEFDDMRFGYSAFGEGSSHNPGRNPLGGSVISGRGMKWNRCSWVGGSRNSVSGSWQVSEVAYIKHRKADPSAPCATAHCVQDDSMFPANS